MSDVESQKPVGEEVSGERHMVQLDFTASLGQQAETRVLFSPVAAGGDNTNLRLTWSNEETLGVYIKSGTSYFYAGTLTGTGASGTTSCVFTGQVLSKREGEEYLFMHPAIAGETVGSAAQGSISFNNASASINGTSHLNSVLPLLWHESSAGSNTPAEYQGLVIIAHLQFATDPDQIQSVTLQTMDRDTDDPVFTSTFSAATMSGSPTLSKSITVNISSGSLNQDQSTHLYEGEVYIPCGHSSADVFRSKYNLKVVTKDGKTYYSEYLSFPGQDSAPSSILTMPLANGKCYTLTAPMSEGFAPTVISSQYKVNSLLGMWNEFGKPYDPNGLIVYSGEGDLPSSLPTQLADNKASILARYMNNGTGTPTFFGAGTTSLYESGRGDDVKQDNVTFNNITLTSPSEVFVTFISEFGWNENLLGYYHYPQDGTPTSSSVTKTLIFPNVSKPAHEPFNKGVGQDKNNIGTADDAPLREFETVKLLYTDPQTGISTTTFPAGVSIGFFMMIDTEAREDSPKSGYDLLNWNQWRLFTNSAWNADNSKWPATGYTNSNFFASGDVCNGDSPVQGLAIYGVKDRGDNNDATAYGAMIFMVSTSVPTAMQTQNTAYFNIGDGDLVKAKQ